MAAGAAEHDEDDEREAWARDMVRGLPPMSRPDTEGLECIRRLIGFTAGVWMKSA